MVNAKRYQRLVTAIQELSLARDVQTVSAIVRDVARELTGADGATFILREGNQCFYADENAITSLWKGKRFPMEKCVSGWVMINREPVIIGDIYQDDRVPHDAYRPTFVKSLAVVPIRTLDPIGAIGNYWAAHYVPTEEELNMLRSLADTTAVALENVRVYQELEQRVRDRTRELQDANEKLGSQNEELETIAYSLSHDLRGPLRHIDHYARILQENLIEDKGAESEAIFRKIAGKVDGMQSLITDLLGLFRMGRQELRISEVNMKDVVSNVFEELVDAEQQRNITFDLAEDLPSACVDKVLIRQVWVNLISNAIKYTRGRANAHIKVDYRLVENAIVYSIEDNGVGFDMQHYEKVFQPFQRLHATSDFEGAGIGLAIVDRIVKKHRGTLWAQSAVNKGSSFYISIPTYGSPLKESILAITHSSEIQ